MHQATHYTVIPNGTKHTLHIGLYIHSTRTEQRTETQNITSDDNTNAYNIDEVTGLLNKADQVHM